MKPNKFEWKSSCMSLFNKLGGHMIITKFKYFRHKLGSWLIITLKEISYKQFIDL